MPIHNIENYLIQLIHLLSMKTIDSTKMEEMEKRLRRLNIKNKISRLGNIVIYEDDESGRGILYVRDMPIEETGGSKEFYDEQSTSFNPKHKNIQWPYTGFVQGSILGWYPISVPELHKWIEASPGYKVDEFVDDFYDSVLRQIGSNQ